jgi:hypothetical protein
MSAQFAPAAREDSLRLEDSLRVLQPSRSASIQRLELGALVVGTLLVTDRDTPNGVRGPAWPPCHQERVPWHESWRPTRTTSRLARATAAVRAVQGTGTTCPLEDHEQAAIFTVTRSTDSPGIRTASPDSR